MPKKKPAKKGEEAKPLLQKAKRKKDDVLLTRDQRAALFLEDINKKLNGRGMLKLARDYSLPWMKRRVPTGILSLDIKLGGGFPTGGLSQIDGKANAGKNYICWLLVRQLQMLVGKKLKVLFALTEMKLDKVQGRRAGAKVALNEDDIKGLEAGRVAGGLPPFTPEELADMREETGEIHELHGESGEDLYDGILKAVRDNVYHLIIIDSLGNIMSKAEAEAESLNDKTRGGASKVNSEFCRKLSALLTMDDPETGVRDTCVIGINQVRDDMKNPDGLKSTGGRALEHAKFINLTLTSAAKHTQTMKQYWTQGNRDVDDMIAKDVHWRITKGKAGIHEGAQGWYKFVFKNQDGTPAQFIGCDFYLDTVAVGVQYGVIAQNGAWFYVINQEKPDESLLSGQGIAKFLEALKADTEAKVAAGDYVNSVYEGIRREVLRRAEIYLENKWD